MNTCNMTNRINAYFDGEMSQAEQQEMKAHIQQCKACEAELASLVELSGLMADIKLPELSRQGLEKMHVAIEKAQFRLMERVAGALGAMAASLAVATALWTSSNANTAAAAVDGPVSRWEQAAIKLTDIPAATVEMNMAEWVVADLSGEITDVD